MNFNASKLPINNKSKGPDEIFSLIELLGVKHYISNLVTLLPALFYHSNLDLVIGLVSFCLLTSAISCLNALGDVLSDLAHPKRKNKPLPSGAVSETTAKIAVMVLLLVSFRLAFFLPLSIMPFFIFYFLFFILYFVISTFYSIGARKDAGMSGLLIFTGIIIRIFVGIDLVDAPNEVVWLIVPGGILALAISIGQRVIEVKQGSSQQYRKKSPMC